MNDILFKIFPFLAKRMSNHASNLLSGFGLLALLLLGLYVISLSGFKESSGVLFFAFLTVTSMIPISFLILWIFEVKHKWDMRIVAVIPPSGHAFPQNAINAKRAGYRFRSMSKAERSEWGLDKKKDMLPVLFGKLLRRTNEQIEAQRLEIKLSDPRLSVQEFIQIREIQKRKKTKPETS